MTNIQTAFDMALRLHQSGALEEAISIYFQILSSDQNNPHLLFLLGTALGQIGQHEEGIAYLQKSASIVPNPITYNNIASSFTALCRHHEAIQSLQKAVDLDPNYSEGFCHLGTAQRNAGLLHDSLHSLESATRLSPNYREAITEKGITLSSLGEHAHSLECHINASKLDPAFADSYKHIGDAMLKMDRISEALFNYAKAIELKPKNVEAFSNRGGALKKAGRLDEALADYNIAIALRPGCADTYNNRGNTLRDLHRLNEALTDYNRAISIRPDYAEAYNNRGNTLKDLHRFDEALADFNRAITLRPDYAEAYSNQGSMLIEVHRFNEALDNFNRAITANADYAEAYWNKSLLLILSGQYEEGWKLYEWRTRTKAQMQNHYNFQIKKWRGLEDISNKKLLIYAEQGFGDFIQFCRYLPLVKQRVDELIVEVPPALIPLVSTLDCEMTVVPKGDKLPDFDAYCPIMSLPYAFGTLIDTIPTKIPYLFSDKEKVRHLRQKLGQTSRPRIGIAWSGSSIHKNDQNRSIRLDALKTLLNTPVEWHSIQKEYRDHDLKFLAEKSEINHHQDDLHDFSDTAALIECMDLVITVDTSVAHVAGALGKPVWILLPYTPDYRWMLNRNDSPWYPTAKLFRQPTLGAWQSVIQSVHSELCRLLQAPLNHWMA